MRRNRSFESTDSESESCRKSKQFGGHLQPMSVSRPTSQRKLSCEEIINEMEKEQDAMVVRLLRELEKVKEENVHLRKQLAMTHSRDNSDRELNGEEYESNYHYSLVEYPSTPNTSLVSRARRPSSMSQSLSLETPAQSMHKKRGSSVVGPSGASATILLNDERHSVTDVDPRLAVPRGWSMSDEVPKRRVEVGDGTRRLQEYRLK